MGKERKESVGIANFVSSFIQRWWAQGDFLTTNLFFNRDTFNWKSWFRFTAMFNSGILTGVRVLHLLWTWYWSVLKCCWHINIPLFLYTFPESVIINSVSAYNCNKVVSPVSFKLWITRGYFNYTYAFIFGPAWNMATLNWEVSPKNTVSMIIPCSPLQNSRSILY